ncbi:hypothetical protein UFOVP1516_53 [uncultured Caudovirales phage]|uniref:Uncharacterized protein n=1 Tax=uncultured Caudovirales phage TaxID=2100421 RepID=A0A6J7XA84_9CAUD|nr:hypothetical protein UFOVP887_82 [uncultured Caudovirales phage]CAB5226899.1 hypothetical protein UFOVP1516_53 [uncultured Caudovirales phage]
MVDYNEQRELIQQTVKETLLSLGLEVDDPIKVQRDFQHLREWRETTEALKSKGLMTLFGIIVAGVLGFMWIGFKGSVGMK